MNIIIRCKLIVEEEKNHVTIPLSRVQIKCQAYSPFLGLSDISIYPWDSTLIVIQNKFHAKNSKVPAGIAFLASFSECVHSH